MNALDLVDSIPVTTATFTKAVAVLQSNYGTEYADEKIAILFDMIRDEGWTEYRFQQTLRWFLKNKPFAAWTIADWFSFSVKVYPLAWCQGRNGDYESYELPDGTTVFKPRDGQTLPFPEGKLTCRSCGQKMPRSTDHKWNLCREVA